MAIVAVVMLSSCSTIKNFTYLQNIDETDLSPSKGLYNARIMPNDELTIIVNTTDKDVAQQFNLYTTNQAGGGMQNMRIAYLVENDGTINFPVVGKIHVQGLTRAECQIKIANKIKEFLADGEEPIVLVRMSGYHVTLLGEVRSPGVKQVDQEKISIIDALAQAGDLTEYGKRNNILIIREDKYGEKSTVRLNLNDANIINSPYYYLQQNDVVYVEPVKAKARNSAISSNVSLWITLTSSLLSLTSLTIALLKK